MSYLAIHPSLRGKKLSTTFIKMACSIFNENSQYRSKNFEFIVSKIHGKVIQKDSFFNKHFSEQYLKSLPFLFLVECDSVEMKNSAMEPAVRHAIYASLGFLCLDMEYIQPPLAGFEPVPEMLLLVHQSCSREEYLVDSLSLKVFLWEFYTSCHFYIVEKDSTTCFMHSWKSLNREQIPLLPKLPWNKTSTFSKP